MAAHDKNPNTRLVQYLNGEKKLASAVQILDWLSKGPLIDVTGLETRFCDIWSPKHMTIDMTVILHAFK